MCNYFFLTSRNAYHTKKSHIRSDPICDMVYIYKMVTQNTSHTCEGKEVFLEEKIRFSIAVDQKNALTRSNYRFHLNVCTYISVTI